MDQISKQLFSGSRLTFDQNRRLRVGNTQRKFDRAANGRRLTNDAFLAGYGAAQAVPGPLFTFAAYLGAVMSTQPNGWAGAQLCLVAIFLPSFLLVIGALPFWDALRKRRWAQSALSGVNAAVVGLLLAALYQPVWTVGITSAEDFALAIAAFLLLFMWRAPPWLVVILSAAAGALITNL